ncbi:unnamed protein product, partial [Rotaria magnacalcarata]
NTRLFGSNNAQQLALNVESNNNYQYKLSYFQWLIMLFIRYL